MTTATPPRASRREWIGLVVLALPTLLISMDMTVLYLAVPHLSSDLEPSSTELLWIMDIYGFLIAGALVPAGALGDRIGRKRILLIGAALFGVASVIAAYADSAAMLVTSRALLGIAGATLMPSALSLTRVMFHRGTQRSFAVAVIMTSFSVGTAAGPLIGGMLLEHFWWGSVFLLGVPVMLLLLAVGPALLPEYRDPGAGRIDLPSTALALAAVLGVVYAIKHVSTARPDLVFALTLLLGVTLGLLFVRRQNHLDDPLLDLSLLRDRVINTSLGTYLLGLFAMGGTQLFIALYLQEVLDLSPFLAGAWMVPAAAGTIVGSLLAPLLARRLRPGKVITGSLTVAALGFAALSQVGPDDLALLIIGYELVALGLSPMIALCADFVISTAPPERAGAASALSESSGELGVALGVALLGTFGTAVYRSHLTDHLPDGLPAATADAARSTLGGASEAAADLPRHLAEPLLAATRGAFASGLGQTSAVAVVIVLAAAVLAGVRLRHLPTSTETERAAEQAAEQSGVPQNGA
ncbi:MFS transporter [Streptomyces anulatus]|uniref:MFS transporter n=1 Tax=Streptomyces anulatus TaxID=1892 RepID=UPI0016742815|nr:MFS transporter [Streptomyces anulatus]GGY55115.1 MFS transporter [Streptomyces anulatus]